MNRSHCEFIKQKLSAGATLLDVRTYDEYIRGALPGAMHIPLNILSVVAHERVDRDQEILVYCRAGSRALMAEKILTNLGYSKVTALGGLAQLQPCTSM